MSMAIAATVPTYRLRLPRPHVAQRQVVAEASRFNVLACGRRWGKTTLAIDRLIQPVLQGKPAAWFAPTYKNLGEAWRDVKKALAPLIRRVSEQEHRLELLTNGVIDFWSLDGATAETTRGRKYALAIVDEAALVVNLDSVWQEVIRPTLTDMRGGAWFLSSPRGFNYFKTLFDYGQDPLRPLWKSWQMPTGSNPFIDQEEIELARQDTAESRFNQEYLAQFVAFEGAVFRNVMQRAIAQPQGGPLKEHDYVFGVDWGRSLDYTVVTVLDATARAVVHVDRFNQIDYSVQRDRLKAAWEHWRPAVVIAEANSMGQPIIDQLHRDGLNVVPFMTTQFSKAQVIGELALAFERADIAIIPDTVLLAELQAYQQEPTASGMMRYGAPSGQHDDTVMSLAMAWSALAEDRGPMVMVHEERVVISEY